MILLTSQGTSHCSCLEHCFLFKKVRDDSAFIYERQVLYNISERSAKRLRRFRHIHLSDRKVETFGCSTSVILYVSLD